MSSDFQFCTLVISGQRFGVPVKRVQAVLRGQPMTRVPGAPPTIRGLLNLRGQILVAVDLRRRLGLEDRPAGLPQLNVVVTTAHGPVSLLVDEVCEVVQVEAWAYEPAPRQLSAEARQLVPGAYLQEDGLLLVLDVDALVSTPSSVGPIP